MTAVRRTVPFQVVINFHMMEQGRSNECFHHYITKPDDAVSVFVAEMPMSRITSIGDRVAHRRTVTVYH